MSQIDNDILELRELKTVLTSLERLYINPDFKRVILDEFLTQHPVNLVQGLGRLNLEPQTKLDIERQLECIALFKMYLDNLKSQIADIDIRIADAETLRDEQTRNT